MMKKPAIILLITMLSFAAVAQQTYQLDVKKSKILWNARHTMGGHFGDILFNSGSLNYSAAGQPTSGTFILDMNSMRAADNADAAKNLTVTKRLKTQGFFDMEKYPTATMAVKQITPTGNPATYKVTGDLTLKGMTKPIDFVAVIKPQGNNITATAELKIDRIKWEIDFKPKTKWDFMAALQDKVTADEIPITLKLVFNK